MSASRGHHLFILMYLFRSIHNVNVASSHKNFNCGITGMFDMEGNLTEKSGNLDTSLDVSLYIRDLRANDRVMQANTHTVTLVLLFSSLKTEQKSDNRKQL